MFLQEKVKEINEKFKVLERAFNIVVWGAGVHTAKLFEKTELLSYHIKAILDMNEKKQGELFFGWRIENPREIVWEEIDAVVISVPNQESSITDMLISEFCYKGDIISLYSEKEGTPFYLLYDMKVSSVRYLGNYKNWEELAGKCVGYDDSIIINKVIDSIEKVKNGMAAWERDGCLFYKEKYVYKLCAAILRCVVRNQGKEVRVLDIGGSLGSTWFQNRKYLAGLANLKYIVAEQDHFMEYGHKNLEDETLKFIRSMDRWEDMERFDIILMSGSLQYIPQYKEIIARIKKARPCYVILDRILVSNRRRICMETVPEEIYQGSYPVVIFDEDEIENFFGIDYRLIENDSSSVAEEVYFVDGKAESRFYVFEYVEK